MTESKTAGSLDFEALRHAIERCNLHLLLGFYAEDAELSIVKAGAPQGSPFELSGKAEIAKYLRVVFGQGTSHRVEGEDVVDGDRVTFREVSEYPDGRPGVRRNDAGGARRQDRPPGGRGGNCRSLMMIRSVMVRKAHTT